MADSQPPPASEPKISYSAPNPEIKADAKPLKPPNPMWKYMGFGENFRPKLPSRNWTIFLTITGSFTAAVIYDKRETKRAQRKWCKLVEHIAKEPLDSRSMPRKLTVFLEGPPTDGLRVAQDHFKEYVKPILVASGLDWDFIQGRKEGDVRAELAERIRNSRLPPDQRTEEDVISDARKRSGIQDFEGPRGDIVIGRHTWKEYVRGLHEGWLGPLTEPPKPLEDAIPQPPKEQAKGTITMETAPGITLLSEPRDADDTPPPETPETLQAANEKPKKPPQPAPFILVSSYPNAPTPSDLPTEFDPSIPISFPHILGFLNTPKRLYRFLNRRVLADSIGRDTAAIILSTYRPFHSTPIPSPAASSLAEDSAETDSAAPPQTAELQAALREEEKEWHKSARVRVAGEPERTWLEPVVLDSRIASRMRKPELTADDEARAAGIVVPEVEIEGWIKGGMRSLGKKGLSMVGLGGEEKKMKTETVDLGAEEVLE
ncbi:hypothetical protein LZ554_004838 [Drepanopeziza brunnea f. sp. 'monogermtubi']|nr:hypothetical protein LZ554_004838 [Drepanopeziza brunnea f. sp. 'monogermtubi']